MDNYILKWRGGAKADDGMITRIWLVGPFAVESEAIEWAQKDQADCGDDPRWQLVTPFSGRGFHNIVVPVYGPWLPEA